MAPGRLFIWALCGVLAKKRCTAEWGPTPSSCRPKPHDPTRPLRSKSHATAPIPLLCVLASENEGQLQGVEVAFVDLEAGDLGEKGGVEGGPVGGGDEDLGG